MSLNTLSVATLALISLAFACGGSPPTSAPEEVEEVEEIISPAGKSDVASPLGFIKGTWIAANKTQSLGYVVINEDGTFVRGDLCADPDSGPSSTRGSYTLYRTRFLWMVTGEYIRFEPWGDAEASPMYKLSFSGGDYSEGAAELWLKKKRAVAFEFIRGPDTFCVVPEDCEGQVSPQSPTYSLGCSESNTCSVCPPVPYMPTCAYGTTLQPRREAETGCITGYLCLH